MACLGIQKYCRDTRVGEVATSVGMADDVAPEEWLAAVSLDI